MQWLKNNLFVKLALCVVALFSVITIVSLQLQYNDLKAQHSALRAEIAAAEERIEEVKETLDMPFDDEYVIKIAREKLNLRLPEEVVFYNDLSE